MRDRLRLVADHTPCCASQAPVRRRTDTHLLKSPPAPWHGRPGTLTLRVRRAGTVSPGRGCSPFSLIAFEPDEYFLRLRSNGAGSQTQFTLETKRTVTLGLTHLSHLVPTGQSIESTLLNSSRWTCFDAFAAMCASVLFLWSGMPDDSISENDSQVHPWTPIVIHEQEIVSQSPQSCRQSNRLKHQTANAWIWNDEGLIAI